MRWAALSGGERPLPSLPGSSLGTHRDEAPRRPMTYATIVLPMALFGVSMFGLRVPARPHPARGLDSHHAASFQRTQNRFL